eukprot:15238933-Alexandrium_andersonii.AAC.1
MLAPRVRASCRHAHPHKISKAPETAPTNSALSVRTCQSALRRKCCRISKLGVFNVTRAPEAAAARRRARKFASSSS